ncbi:M6 family metalloprotease domain-containing protein [Candidatus Bathyarchaeota archaeon]|nr:M6 family metalloprotease domain-containing protein [Candidatus Bathyarchaeota archaeon]
MSSKHVRVVGLLLLLLALPSAFAAAAASTIWGIEGSNSFEPIVWYAPPLNGGGVPPRFAPEPIGEAETTPEGAVGGIKVVFIAVYFRDLNHTLSISEVRSFVDRMDSYYREVSHGRAWLEADVVGWYRLDKSLSYYGRDGRMVDDPNFDGSIDSWWLLRDAVAVADPYVNFSRYDKLVVIHAGYGQESSKNSNDIWSVAYIGGVWTKTRDGNSFYGGALVPEMEAQGASPLGVACHELAHLIGLLDLYGRNGESYVGRWSLMDRGLWNGDPPGSSPAHPDAWSRIRLEWIPNDKIYMATIGVKTDVALSPAEAEPGEGEYQLVKVPLSSDGKKYYLIEARSRIGFDSALPGEGVVIYAVDEKLQAQGGRVKAYDAVDSTDTLDDAAYTPGMAFVDPKNQFTIRVSASTGGNSYTVQVDRSGPAPDVAIERISFDPPEVQANETVYITAHISNRGTEPAKGFTITCLINGEPHKAFTGLSLNPGESKDLNTNWRAVEGLNVVRFQVEPTTLTGDSDMSNNVLETTLAVGYSLIIMVPVNATVRVNGTAYTPGPGGRVAVQAAPGSRVTVEVERIVDQGGGTRSVFKGWDDGSQENPRTVTVQGIETLEAEYGRQYLVDVDPDIGEVKGGGWYDENSTARIEAEDPCRVQEGVTRLTFSGWKGDLEGTSPIVELTVDQPLRIQATWTRQYYLRVVSPFGSTMGEGWYDEGKAASFAVVNQTIEGNGTRARFMGWTGDYRGAQPSAALTVDGPKEIRAVWLIEYLLTLESPYGDPEGGGWYPEGRTANISISRIVQGGDGVRHAFKAWTGDLEASTPEASVKMDSPKHVRATWSTQYRLLLEAVGLSSSSKPVFNVTIDGRQYRYGVQPGQGAEIWLDEGEAFTVSAVERVPSRIGFYILDHLEDENGYPLEGQLTADSPHTVRAVYRQSFGCLIATAAYESELSPQVQYLRDFRDGLVMKTFAGSSFMKVFNAWYYSFSPSLAPELAKSETGKAIARIWLKPLLGILEGSSLVYAKLGRWPEAAVVAAGIEASLLIGLVYLSPIASPIAVKAWRRKGKLELSTRIMGTLVGLSLMLTGIAELSALQTFMEASSAILVLTFMAVGSLIPALAAAAYSKSRRNRSKP